MEQIKRTCTLKPSDFVKREDDVHSYLNKDDLTVIELSFDLKHKDVIHRLSINNHDELVYLLNLAVGRIYEKQNTTIRSTDLSRQQIIVGVNKLQ